MLVTRDRYGTDFCELVGAPPTKVNRQAIAAWLQAEGGTARWNGLNTTLEVVGSWDYNSVGVQNYPTYTIGVEANAETLLDGAAMKGDPYNYQPILFNLRNDKGAFRVLNALRKSAWGTGGLAVICLPQVKISWPYYKNLPIPGST
jgi:hypothetical protein